MSRARMRRRARIERIKQVPFLEALEAVVPGVEIPHRLPAHILCLLPDHQERTPSFYLHEDWWWCFGCSRGSDIINLVREIRDPDLDRALSYLERVLEFEEIKLEDVLESLVSRARSGARDPDSVTLGEWEVEIDHLSKMFLHRARPYLRCRDPLVYDVAWSRAGFVFHELDEQARMIPRTGRGARERLRELRAWVGGWARGLEVDIGRLTGKDRLDAALQR